MTEPNPLPSGETCVPVRCGSVAPDHAEAVCDKDPDHVGPSHFDSATAHAWPTEATYRMVGEIRGGSVEWTTDPFDWDGAYVYVEVPR